MKTLHGGYGRLLLLVLLATMALWPAAVSARTLLEAGSATVWKYADEGEPPDAA